LAAGTLLLCMIVFAASAIALIRPMPKLGIATRKRALGGLGVAFALLIMTALIIPPRPVAPSPQAKPVAASAAPAKLVSSSHADLPAIERVALPEGAPPAPSTGFCPDNELCEVHRATFERRDWPKAWKGDYQGQRNVAFCLANGCDGAVAVNRVAACAWRIVIIGAAHDEAGDTDATSVGIDCGKLDGAGRAAATVKAQALFKRIYRKPLP
jgi:hypothetical protein